MATNRSEVLQVLLGALAEFNEDLAACNPIPVSEQACLAPGAGALDSLGFVNLVTLMESRVEERYGLSLALADASEAAGDAGPWHSVGALADYVCARIDATRGAA